MHGSSIPIVIFSLIFLAFAAGALAADAQVTPKVPTPPPLNPAEKVNLPSGEQVKEKVVGFVGKIVSFFKDDFFPNLWMYLTIVFMIVLAVIVFAAINFLVRAVTDPIFHKVLRFKEESRVPGLIGGVVSIVVAFIVFQFVYRAFPALQPPLQFLVRHFR